MQLQLDQTDYRILMLLSENARIPWKDLGEQIHMTGQAVGNRIKKLEEHGVISAYSLMIDEMKLGLTCTAFVLIFMKTAHHDLFIRFVQERDEVVEAHRISGDGCYHLTIKAASNEQLNQFLDKLLEHGNYRLNLSIHKIKHRHALNAIPTNQT
ncbi:Lrp/AsnC family transcriptional regulator [Paenibacillus soyae]|uniref:Lrp/AsnC family transcriptional regulator n=1 Tax=Paenibacillus soyae TaxID=2969249 RepID=A0A9X2MVI3_9BACL|nr:Lrp/AsnC family transcriptional regulator [Paenibacillus soyae]MCR2807074.1 Lrp/AsnC family transcriptional regulator [Paenibacillus soyae]